MAKKSEKATVIERTELVFTMQTRGYRRCEIIQYASENGWDIGDRQVDNYILKANEILQAQSETVRERELGRAISNFRELYKKSFEIHDFKACKDIQKEIVSLLGLSEAKKLDHTTDGEKLSINIVKSYNEPDKSNL